MLSIFCTLAVVTCPVDKQMIQNEIIHQAVEANVSVQKSLGVAECESQFDPGPRTQALPPKEFISLLIRLGRITALGMCITMWITLRALLNYIHDTNRGGNVN